MWLEVPRRLRRALIPGGAAMSALLIVLASARAQDQPATNPPPQTPQQSTPPSPSAPASSVQTPSTPAPAPSPQTSGGGTQLPQINVRAARRPAPRPVARRAAPTTVAPTTTVPPVSPAEVLTQRSNSLDQARSNLYTTVGTTSDTKSRETIEALPEGTNAPV